MHGDQFHYEHGDQRDNLGFWVNPRDWADWEFSVAKPGKFEISAQIAAPERSTVSISVGTEKLRGQISVTGDYGNFVTMKLGTLQISSAGKTTLALHAISEDWRPVNVKSIRLTPAPTGQ